MLKPDGPDDTVVTVQFLASMVRTYFGDGEELGMHLTYGTEQLAARNGRLGQERLGGPGRDSFLVISGDSLTDVDLGALVGAHRARDAFGQGLPGPPDGARQCASPSSGHRA